MMRVKILTNLGSVEFPENRYLENEEHEVPDSFGERLVKRKLAVNVTPPPVLGVAETPDLIGVQEESQPSAGPSASAKHKKRGEVNNG